MTYFVETQVVDSTILEADREKLPEGVLMRVRWAEASVADCRNGNGRIYRKPTMKRESLRLHENAESGTVMMNADHPGPVTGGQAPVAGPHGVCAILRKCSFDESAGTLSLDEVDILDTTSGRDVATIIRAKGRLGVSTRGKGSSSKGRIKTSDGKELEGEIIGDDYQLETLDVVINPSVKVARVTDFREGQENEAMTLEELKQKHPELVKQIEESAVKAKSEELLGQVAEKLLEKQDEIRAQLSEEFNSKVESLQSEIKNKNEQIEKLSKDNRILESAGSKNDKILEERLAKLEGERELERMATYIESTVKGHVFESELREAAKDCKTVEAATAEINRAKALLEKAAEKQKSLAEGRGESRPDAPEKNESASTTPSGSSSTARGRRLAGRE